MYKNANHLRTAFAAALVLAAPSTAILGQAAAPPSALKPRIDALLQKMTPRGARVAVHVRAVTGGEVLYRREDDVPRILASNAKLFTTAAAVLFLGPRFEWVTVLGARGTRDASGVLQGPLVVVGSGDPNFSGRFHDGNPTAVFERWADDLGREGIREVAGDLLLDDTVFDREFYAEPWSPAYRADWYAAETAGLSLNDNCIDLTLGPGPRPGEPIVFSLSPPTAYVRVASTARTVAGKGDERITIVRAGEANEVQVGGEIGVRAAPGVHFVTVHHPVRYFGAVLKETLERRGIRIRGDPKEVPPDHRPASHPVRYLTEHRSPLPESLQVVNRHSQNFYAEQLLKTLGYQKTGQGTRADGIAAVQEALRRLEVEDPVSLEDGSGLSRGNRACARALATLLAKMLDPPHAKLFTDSLAVPGEPGSLEKRFTEAAYRARVKAKTGYISGVSALSGYLETKRGRVAAFSILLNDLPAGAADRARALQDAIVKAVIDLE